MIAALLFVLICSICGWKVLTALSNPRRFAELPTLVSVVFAGWLVPQMYSILVSDNSKEFGFVMAEMVGLLLLLSLNFGWWLASTKNPKQPKFLPDGSAAFKMTILCTVVGSIFSIWLATLPTELTGISQLTGLPTILLLFRRFQVLALVFSVIFFFKFGEKRFFWLLVVNFIFLVPSALWYVRRESILEYSLIFFCAYCFFRKALPSRLVILTVALGLTIVVNFAGEFRAVLLQSDNDGIVSTRDAASVDFGNADFSRDSADPMMSEFGNAVRIIEKINEGSGITYGARIWSNLIFSYVPGQWIGFNTKSALKVLDNDVANDLRVDSYVGSTYTAIGDTYDAFYFFGAFVFIVVGYLYGKIFVAASRGDLVSQCLYTFILMAPLVSISHGVMLLVQRLPAALTFFYLSIRLSRTQL